MKHFMNSVAIAAVLAIAVPALAQAQSSGPRPARPKAAHASTGHKHAGHASRAHVRTARSVTTTRTVSPSDNVADQLNGQELQRLEASSAPAAMPIPPRSVARPQPGLSTSSGTYIPPSPPGPVYASPADEGPKTSGGGYIPAPTGPMPMPPPPPISAPTR